MEFTVKCPRCGAQNDIEVDTGLAEDGDVYHDIVECECGGVFLARTTIRADVDVLTVNEDG